MVLADLHLHFRISIYTPTEYNNLVPTLLCHTLWIIPVAITSSIDDDAPI